MASLNTDKARQTIRSFIDSRVQEQSVSVHTGIVTEWTTGVELKVRLTSVVGNPTLSWKDGHILVLNGQTFAKDDQLILFPIAGRYFVMGEISSTLP